MNELLLKLQEANRAVNQLMQMLEKAKEEKETLSRKVAELEQSIDDKQHAYDELIESLCTRKNRLVFKRDRYLS